MSRQQKNTRLTSIQSLFFQPMCLKNWLLLFLIFFTQNYKTVESKPVYFDSINSYSIEKDSFKIQLFHESSGDFIQKVNVFNTCDFSSSESQKNGTISIAVGVGECCDFTFSKANYTTKEVTLCATEDKSGIHLVSPSQIKKLPTSEIKGIQSLPKSSLIYKDIDKNIYLKKSDNQPFSGEYKGLFYKNGHIKPADFCCSFQAEENEFTIKSPTILKNESGTNQILKIGLASEINLQVKGLVLEEKHEFPIEEAKVILVNEKNTKDYQIRLTNLDGIFDFSLRKNECYQLWVEKENYKQVGAPIQICTNQNTDSQSFEFNIFLK